MVQNIQIKTEEINGFGEYQNNPSERVSEVIKSYLEDGWTIIFQSVFNRVQDYNIWTVHVIVFQKGMYQYEYWGFGNETD